MKKLFARVLTVVLATCMMAGCASSTSSSIVTSSIATSDASSEVETAKTLSVVTTIFPVYDWTKEILGEDLENVTLTYLEDTGVDVHSYEPTVEDMVAIADCDMFIYIGGESDDWVEAVLANAENPDMVVINLIDVLGDAVKEEVLVEGMEETDHDHGDDEEDHDHDDDEEDHDHDDEEDHDHDEGEVDEHVWLSLSNARAVCQAIAWELVTLNPEKAELYTLNVASYDAKLAALDADYQEVVADATYTTLLFADRFPFMYMMDDYGLSYYAAFAGCSTETEASFETIIFLAQKIDELGLETIMVTETSNQAIANSVQTNTYFADQVILVLDSMQAVTAQEVIEGATYLSIMESNLLVLEQAVNPMV